MHIHYREPVAKQLFTLIMMSHVLINSKSNLIHASTGVHMF